MQIELIVLETKLSHLAHLKTQILVTVLPSYRVAGRLPDHTTSKTARTAARETGRCTGRTEWGGEQIGDRALPAEKATRATGAILAFGPAIIILASIYLSGICTKSFIMSLVI